MRLPLALLIPITFAACHAAPVADGPVGRATARISQVPSGVACVSITVIGDRTVMHAADVVAGQPALLQFDDLPVGLDAFSAAAFSMSCSSINGAQPSWTTAQPFYASITQGGLTPLTLTLEPAGGAVIGIDWGDGGAPPDLTTGPDGGWPYDAGGGGDMAYPPVDLAYPTVDLAY